MKLIVRLPNWIGDTLMTLPSLHVLHEAGFELHCFGPAWAPDLLGGMPFETLVLPKPILKAAARLLVARGWRALVFPYSFSSAASLFLAGKRVVGFSADARAWMLKKSCFYDRSIHYVERYWQAAQLAQATFLPQADWPSVIPSRLNLPLNDTAVAAAKQVLNQQGVQQPFWVLSTGATGLIDGQPKVWPHWLELAQYLTEKGIQLVACTTHKEQADCEAQLPGARVFVDLPLSVVGAILAMSQQVVANDSGMMHLAAAVNAPVLGVFGRTYPVRTAPWGGACCGDEHGWPSLAKVKTALEGTCVIR